MPSDRARHVGRHQASLRGPGCELHLRRLLAQHDRDRRPADRHPQACGAGRRRDSWPAAPRRPVRVRAHRRAPLRPGLHAGERAHGGRARVLAWRVRRRDAGQPKRGFPPRDRPARRPRVRTHTHRRHRRVGGLQRPAGEPAAARRREAGRRSLIPTTNGRPAVLVVGPPRYAGPLGMMRSLGRLGIPVFGLAHRSPSAADVSRYCAGLVDAGSDGRPWEDESRTMGELAAAARRLGDGTILVAGSDEWAVFLARHSQDLGGRFLLPLASSRVVEELAAKDGLFRLATKHGLPTPRIVFPANRAQAQVEAAGLDYPVMLKPIHSRPDVLEKAVVDDSTQLLAAYDRMEESPDAPNVMFQEYIPGRDQDVWIFNGYFD